MGAAGAGRAAAEGTETLTRDSGGSSAFWGVRTLLPHLLGNPSARIPWFIPRLELDLCQGSDMRMPSLAQGQDQALLGGPEAPANPDPPRLSGTSAGPCPAHLACVVPAGSAVLREHPVRALSIRTSSLRPLGSARTWCLSPLPHPVALSMPLHTAGAQSPLLEARPLRSPADSPPETGGFGSHWKSPVSVHKAVAAAPLALMLGKGELWPRHLALEADLNQAAVFFRRQKMEFA